MEKIKNIIVLIVELALVAVIILFIAVYVGSGKAEKNYKSTLSFIKNGDWGSALKRIEYIPHYKDSSELYIYIYPNYLYYNNYKTAAEKEKGYRGVLSYIKNERNHLNNLKYKNSFSELEKTINFKLEEMSAEKQNIKMERTLNESAAMIRKGDFIGAKEKLNFITGQSYMERLGQLYAYMDLLDAVNLNDDKAILASIKGLNPNYTGVLSNEISNEVLKVVDSEKWYSASAEILSTDSQAYSIEKNLKREEVLSLMGSPQNNKLISNEYGIFETMIYENNLILYFENNILKAFKD